MAYSYKKIISLIDLTSLNEDDTEQTVLDLCARAQTPLGVVAAVCIYPRFVKIAKTALVDSSIRIATVINFPSGNEPLAMSLALTKQAIEDGADEIDLVMPYAALMQGEMAKVHDYIVAVREACADHLLKLILETGVIQEPGLIKIASDLGLKCGVDFLKTSTGKVAVNATRSAVEIMLQSISDSDRSVGIKVAGGVRTFKQACEYLLLAEKYLGKDQLNPKRFRFGTSGLLDQLLTNSGKNEGY